MRRYLVLGMLCAVATTAGPVRARNVNHNASSSNTGNFIATWETGELGGTVTASDARGSEATVSDDGTVTGGPTHSQTACVSITATDGTTDIGCGPISIEYATQPVVIGLPVGLVVHASGAIPTQRTDPGGEVSADTVLIDIVWDPSALDASTPPQVIVEPGGCEDLSLPDSASCSTGGVSVSKKLGRGGARGTVSSDALGTLANDAVADEASVVEEGARQNTSLN